MEGLEPSKAERRMTVNIAEALPFSGLPAGLKTDRKGTLPPYGDCVAMSF